VVAVLPSIPIRALKLGRRISLTSAARGPDKGLSCAGSSSCLAPTLKVWEGVLARAFSREYFLGGLGGAIASGARTFRDGGAPKIP